MAIAFVKATLVVLFFMHVRYSPRLTWLAVSSGVVWLGILLSLTMTDYATRGRIQSQPPVVPLSQPRSTGTLTP